MWSSNTKMPGPEVEIRLRIAEMSLPLLLQGEAATRVQLCNNGDGTYGLEADGMLGVTREAGVRPAVDVLVGLLNDYADAMDRLEAEHELPAAVADAFDDLSRRWGEYVSEPRPDPALALRREEASDG